MQSTNSLEKTLTLAKIEGQRRWGQQRTRWLNGITDSIDMNLSKLWEIVSSRTEHGVQQFMGLQRIRNNLVTEKQQQKNEIKF